MTTKVHHVIIQLSKPSGDSAGSVAEGRYTYEDGTVTLTDRLGVCVRDGEGKTYGEKIADGEDPQTIAARLTRKFRQALRGKGAHASDFNRQIRYPRTGWR
jgi:hypothetical protein